MGILKEETHDSSSSSMTYATRWKYENISVAAIVLIAITLITLLIISMQGRTQVNVVMADQVKDTESYDTMVQSMFDEQAIILRPEDKVSMALNNSIDDGNKLHIQRAVEINVIVDGEAKSRFTTQETVKGAIQELGVSLTEHDKVFPSITSEITDKLEIKVVRINKQIVDRTEQVPFRVIKTSDETLLKGNVKVAQNGQPGKIVHRIEKIYADGKFVSMKMVGTDVQSSTQDKVVLVGTKVEVKEPVVVASSEVSKKVTKEKVAKAKVKVTSKKSNVVKASASDNKLSRAGVDFTYKKVLKNVSMTAYSSEQPGIGTRTASGTRVTEGRTIAVDRNIIPMGWWVYIEGIGLRRAEDTGGAIKGNKIDVYYDSVQHARNFGRKSGQTVYVIGPIKPQLN